ncbi:MAG: S41 family peptidase [Chloroflexota bacterium]
MMKRLLKIGLLAATIFVFSSVSFGAGVAFSGYGSLLTPSIVRAADQPVEFDIFWQAWNLVQRNFVDRDAVDPARLTYGAIKGMIEALGDEGHTTFLTPTESEQQRTSISGKFFGIGATLGFENGLPVIVSPFDGSPADQAGVNAGDVIIEVNGEDVTSWTLGEIVDVIRGPEGTEVILTLLRAGEQTSLEVPIVRGEIEVPTTTWALVPGTDIAHIRLSRFSANANETMVKALEGAKEAGATALILDLRNNPGGLLEQAINVTSQFLTDGNVLQQEDASGQRRAFEVREGGLATDIPVVVLTNRGSASSAEIFAGAIQDHERGLVVGETTFGTGTVLRPFQLSDGSTLMLGTSQWLTANGRLIRKQGVEPDVIVEVPLGTDLLSPAQIENFTIEELRTTDDAQLLKALELLEAFPQESKDIR